MGFIRYLWVLSGKDNISLAFVEGWGKHVPQRCTVKMSVEYIICEDFCQFVILYIQLFL